MKKSLPLFTAILTSFLLALPVYAADIRLSSRCTLADAILAANNDRAESDCPAGRGGDTITLTEDITLQAELPAITSDITIEGNGYTISGDNRWRIFYNDGGALTIHDLTMTKGRAENEDELIITNSFSGNSTDIGGVIYNFGILSISDSVFSHNSADRLGGAIYNGGGLSIVNSVFSHNSANGLGGAVYNFGILSMANSSFSDNSANGLGGAILNGGDSELSISDSAFSNNSTDKHGGAVYNFGILSMANSSFSDNSAGRGGAIFNGGDSELSISDSAFSNNSASGFSGAIENWGELSIANSTFSGNSAVKGGAILNRRDRKLSITSSTFSHNSAVMDGGAIDNRGELSIVNSIIAGIAGDTCHSNSRLKLNIRNFIQDGACSPAFSGDPMLGELVEPEDGSPAYFPLLAGSRAIDAADDAHCPATDQIRHVRPQGAGCDIGAIEYVAPLRPALKETP